MKDESKKIIDLLFDVNSDLTVSDQKKEKLISLINGFEKELIELIRDQEHSKLKNIPADKSTKTKKHEANIAGVGEHNKEEESAESIIGALQVLIKKEKKGSGLKKNKLAGNNGEVEVSEMTLHRQNKIKKMKDFLLTGEDSRDNDIVNFDLQMQKNQLRSERERHAGKFEEKILKKYWDDVFFDCDWKNPNNPKNYADYYFEDTTDERVSYMPIIGFDLPKDFNSDNLIPEKLLKALYSFNRPGIAKNVAFFVNKKNIYILPGGSRTEYPKVQKENIFDNYHDFLECVCNLAEPLSVSSELKKIYKSFETKSNKT